MPFIKPQAASDSRAVCCAPLMRHVSWRAPFLKSMCMTDLPTLPVLNCDVAIVGAGPAGLMAAEQLAGQGLQVCVFDGKASAGRKFLLAGKGGMNLTHSEAFEPFVQRYAARANTLQPLLENFGATQLRAWAHSLGIETFVGSSGRVFPTDMKAAPLLRAWLAHLRSQGVRFW